MLLLLLPCLTHNSALLTPSLQQKAFATSPTVTPDGSQLYIIGPSNRVYNIQTETGRVQWEFLLDDAVQSQPIIYQNEDSLALYVVEARTGRILQFPLDPDNNLIAQEPVWSWELCQDGGDETDIVIEDCTTNHVVQADVSMAESGNILYYGDVNGRITALQVANFATPAPTMSPSATPTMLPSATPTLSMEPTAMNITDTPTESPTAAPTRTQAITATFAPVNGPTTVVGTPTAPVFDTNNGNASVGNKDVDDDDDSSNMGILIGAIVGGVAVILVVAMLVAKNLLRPKRSRKSSKRIPAGATRDLESDIAPKDGPSDEEDDEVYDYNAEDDDDDDDDVTVISGNGDSVELEYNAANAAKGAAKGSGRRCRTPRKKKMSPAKMTRVSTPPTASTLQSIEEVLSEEEKVIDSRKNLNPQFRSVMDDEESAASSEVSSVIPPPPPPSTVPRERTTNEEEKKDPESPRPSHTDMDIKSPVSPASTTSSNGAFLDSVSRALGYVSANASNKEAKEQQEIPAIQPVLSNDSSIYTNNNDEKSKMTTDSSSPLSGVFGEMPNKAKHTLAGPDQDARDSLSMSALDHHTSTPRAPLGGPAQYLAKGSRPRFKPAGKEHVPKVKSARTTRNLAGFTPSYLTQPEDEDDSNLARNRSNESVNKQQARDPKAAPTFKRRTKPDASSSSMADAVGDTWNSFLDELAAAEEKFFAPTPAQKSAVLRYNKDDESTLGPSTIDDAGDEEDDDEDVFSDGDETVKTGVKA